jgi:radical SAM superfamily enzyme YgiQ (UPF0313 family)
MVGQSDVLIVQPPFGGPYNFWKSESLGMGYLASALEEQGYSVALIDAFLEELSIEQTVDRILSSPPRLLLGFSLLSYEMYQTGQAILRRLREAGFDVHVTFGSWFPTFWHELIIGEGVPVNSIVLAEGERSICALTRYLDKGNWGASELFLSRRELDGVLILEQKATLLDVNTLPHPRRDYLNLVVNRYNLATSYTARGCGYNRCTFCSVPAFYKGGPKHRLRTPGNVIEEVKQMAHAGVDFIFFTDEDFIGEPPEGPQRALEIFEGVAACGISMRYTFNCTVAGVEERLMTRLSELGLAAVYIGIESNLDRYLKRFAKGVRSSDVERAVDILRALNIKLVPGWIMFERETTIEEVQESLGFLEKLGAYHVNYLKALYVMKDTNMERMYDNDIYKTYFHSKYYFNDPKVDLLVRIIQTDFLPEVMGYTNGIYPIWHKLLAGYGTDWQQQKYEQINKLMRDLSIRFVREAITRIENGSLAGLAHELTAQVQQWRELGDEIAELAGTFGQPVERNCIEPSAQHGVGTGMS